MYAYQFLSPEDRTEVEALDAKIAELKARLKATFSEEQERLAWDLSAAEDRGTTTCTWPRSTA